MAWPEGVEKSNPEVEELIRHALCDHERSLGDVREQDDDQGVKGVENSVDVELVVSDALY